MTTRKNSRPVEPAELDPTTLAGYRRSGIARSTGTLVALVDGVEHGLVDPTSYEAGDADGWALICVPHNAYELYPTRRAARLAMSAPEAFCAECAKLAKTRAKAPAAPAKAGSK